MRKGGLEIKIMQNSIIFFKVYSLNRFYNVDLRFIKYLYFKELKCQYFSEISINKWDIHT